MSLEFTFTCPLPLGLHARPANALEERARRFNADIVLVNERTTRKANAKSVLGLVALDVRQDDRCKLIIQGEDEARAKEALGRWLTKEFPHCDDALPAVSYKEGELELPISLKVSKAMFRPGTPVSGGVAHGQLVTLGGFQIPESIPLSGVADETEEVMRVNQALASLSEEYEARYASSSGPAAKILKAQAAVAHDPEFKAQLFEAIQQREKTAAGAIVEAEEHFSTMLIATGNPLLMERALDVRDVCFQLLRQIYGLDDQATNVTLRGPSIVVADTLTPGQFLALDHGHVKGMVIAHAGTTSHTVILARSFGLPTLVGVSDLLAGVRDGEEAILDAEIGILVTSPDEFAKRYYQMEERRMINRHKRLDHFAHQPAKTKDGRRIEVAANIATAKEASKAFAKGAEGVGLFRTEMLFLDRDQAPTEDEQFLAYREALEASGEKPIIIRTLDIGGDKPLPYLNLPHEENPFLGYRAVRMYSEFETLFRTQVRALLRASAYGQLKVMVPMISHVDETRWVRRIFSEEQARCESEGIRFDPKMPLGAMIEVPSAGFAMEALCKEMDFFSVGSNDLLQYFTASDRADGRLANVYNPLYPSFWKFLKQIVDGAHAGKRWIGLCGELAQRADCLPLLVAVGFDELSVSGPSIAAVKAGIAELDSRECVTLFEKVVAFASAEEAGEQLRTFSKARNVPLLDSELILVNSESERKEEVIKEAVDRLFVTGRTKRPRDVEKAVWEREMIYSTGFGHGFAVPHCKTDAVEANSLVLVKLNKAVEWGSLDGGLVNVVFLLTIRESDQATEHMKIFSRLARMVMHEDFRQTLQIDLNEAERLHAFLSEKLT